jgi:FtsP/CotA-like multicopper oxidase with cupredoxin domain
MTRHYLTLAATSLAALLTTHAAFAAPSPACAALDDAFPQLGRTGTGENAYRPLPLFSPIRSQAGAPGTLSLGITVDHVSSAPKGAPGTVYVGNYPVTDIPVFRFIKGANTSVQVIRPEDGRAFPIGDVCMASPDWAYAGSEWSLVQGDTLDVMLQSRLDYTGSGALSLPTNGGVPCRASNLHTHGLLVSPYHPTRAGLGPYGDYVLDVTQPRGSLDFGTQIDNCGTPLGTTEHRGHGLTDLPLHYSTFIPGQPGVSSLATGEHPSGLFWYHPHPHGYSGSQIGGGTTGAITIGALTDYACPQGDGTPGNCTITNTNTRVMVLKDREIVAAGTGWTTVQAPESGFCLPTGGTRLGECQGVESKAGPTKWVFTVNGVQFPTARIAAGRMEIWRLVNASASMTYNLSILGIGQGQGHQALPFQVLAKDGVSIAQPNGHAITATQMLLMPATRVEIAIPAPAEGGSYMLHNNVVQTGGNGSGDIWPEVDLARFTWDKPADKPASIAATQPLQVSGPATPIPHVSAVVAGTPGPCTFVPGDKRLIYFVHRFVHVLGGIDPGTHSGILPHTNEVFGLIAGVQHADGTKDFYSQATKTVLHSVKDVWKAGTTDGDAAFPAFDHNDWGTVCTVKGNVEPWELINYTGEDHNFHIHQSRFTLDPNGEFQFPRAGVKDAPALRATDDVVRDFANPIDGTFHDTIPVPRGQTFCADDPSQPGCGNKATTECTGSPNDEQCPHPGKISIIMDFSRAEQVGKFVYHCHIMEHEDGGMMAQISVLCPKGDASCAAQTAQEAICRPPAE